MLLLLSLVVAMTPAHAGKQGHTKLLSPAVRQSREVPIFYISLDAPSGKMRSRCSPALDHPCTFRMRPEW